MGKLPYSSNLFSHQHQELVYALLDAQQEHKSITIFLNNNTQALRSTVLGFNFYENTLLIDGLNPPVNHTVLKCLATMPFWVQLKCGERYLNLQCVMSENRYDLYTLTLLDHKFTNNQRWFSRIYFDTRRGPEISMFVPHHLPIAGHIKNLSAHGALAEFYGTDIREAFTGMESCNCHIGFNDMFSIDLKCDIKKCSFERRPSCHSVLRVTFDASNSHNISRLDNFIDALGNDNPSHSPFALYTEKRFKTRTQSNAPLSTFTI